MSKKRQVIPPIYSDDTLDTYRNKYFQTLSGESFKKRNLGDDLSSIRQFSEYYQTHELPFKKKEKKQKIGKLGMDELTNIVLSMNQDIRQIREAQSLQGAKNWVAKHGPELYTVSDADINGDSIPDIIVKNKAGKNVIVNGYTTADSTFPYRYAYYTAYPTEDERKLAREESGITYRSFINDMYRPQYDEYRMKLQAGNPFGSSVGTDFEKKIAKSGYEKVIRPHNRSPYQAYVSEVVKPIYDVIKQINVILGLKTKSTLLTTIAADVWNQTILIPAMVYVYGDEIGNVSEAEWKKLRNRKEVKNAIMRYVKHYITNSRALIDLVPLFVVTCEKNGNPIPEEVKPWVVRFLMARLLSINPEDLPATDNEDGWAQIEAQFNSRFPEVPAASEAVNQEEAQDE